MRTRSSIILAIAALLVGLIIGGWSVAIHDKRSTERALISVVVSEASMTVAVLNRLRAGNTTNAVECLELTLDGDLLDLGALLDPRELQRAPMNIVALQMVRDYRARFPHKFGSPEVEKAAEKAMRFTVGNQ